MMKKQSARGFTLIEVLIVITLHRRAGQHRAWPTYQNSVRRAREAVLKEDLFRMRDAIDQYYADKNKYPQSLQDLVTDGYLREIPKDPITNSRRHLDDGARGARPEQPGRRARRLQRQERLPRGMSLEGTPYAEWD